MSSATGPASERATDDEPGFRFLAPIGRPTVASRRATIAASSVGIPLRLDRGAALGLIAAAEYPIDRSFFEGVAIAAPRMTISSGADGMLHLAESSRSRARTRTETEVPRALRTTVDEAVERAMMGGARVAVALSGGLDSGAVAIAAHAVNRRLGRPDDALVLYHMLPRAGPSEVHHARSIAQVSGRPLLEFPAPEGDPFESVASLAERSDFPFDGPGANGGLAAFRRLSSEGVDLVLTGDGGDEAFGDVRTGGLRAFVRPVYRALAPRWLVDRRLGRPAWLSNRLRDLRPTPACPPARSGLEGPAAGRDRALRSSRQCAIVGWYRALERVTGIPTSFPFLDPDVEDFVVSLPPERLEAGGRSKGLLRLAFAEDLPAVELVRPKDQPDVEPIVRDDVRRHGDAWADRYLRSGTLERLDLMPAAEASGVIEAASAGTVRDLYRALSLIWISIWAEANGLAPGKAPTTGS